MNPRVILADDHIMVADGLGRIIEAVADLVATVHDGVQLVAASRTLRPDIVVSDISMPGLSGLDALLTLRDDPECPKFIFLTVHDQRALLQRAMRSGAKGYILKHMAGDVLVNAIREVHNGQRYFPDEVGNSHDSETDAHGRTHKFILSPRQTAVLELLSEGRRMKDIAANLGLSVRTVEDHRTRLMEVFGAKTNAELVRMAFDAHLFGEK
jgi:two-component system, NarL family, response regulator NreC